MLTQLDHVQRHEITRGDRPWMTQPMGAGRVQTFTWASGLEEARRMASYLKSLELPPGSRVAIFAKNNAWWILADLAIWMAGHVSVPIYPTLTAASIRQILDHSGAELVFVGKLDGFEAMAPAIAPSLRRVVLPLGPTSLEGPRWGDLVGTHPPLAGKLSRDPDELATIIYTSGSTGEPKGVMHTFRTMSAVEALIALYELRPEDRLLSYLPMSHVAERAILQTTNFIVGFHVYFAESQDTFVEDLRRCRPTVFGSVPRLWLKFHGGVSAKLPDARLRLLLKLPIVSGAIKKKVLAGLGLDAARVAVTGSAPTPPELIEWYAALGLRLHDLYGMTENFAVSHCVRPGEIKPGWVGTPVPGVSCKLADDGEILVKSPGTMIGYFRAEALTRQTIDPDGFLHTGDRGMVDERGALRISGRVKELFKTSKGKYVAPAPIENRLLAHGDIEQACVSGADMPQPYALVVLAEQHRKRGLGPALRAGLEPTLARVRAELNAELDPHERLEKLVVMSEEWTVENGLLTPTMKLKRSAIEARYGQQVGPWYGRPEDVIWA